MSKEEINNALTSKSLLNDFRHTIIDQEKTEPLDHANTHIEEITKLKEAYHNGKTIVVKGMESWNSKIMDLIKYIGVPSIDAHMYVSPTDGTSYDWHTDDRSVIIKMLYGKKKFEVKNGGKEEQYILEPEECLYIEKGVLHRANTIGPSVHLSFGIPTPLSLDSSYPFPMEIKYAE